MYRVGSIDSSDVMIEVMENGHGISLINLVNELDDSLVMNVIAKVMHYYGLEELNAKIYYNGANEWVISARFEALKHYLMNIKEDMQMVMEVDE